MPFLTPGMIEELGILGLSRLSLLPGIPVAAKLILAAMAKVVPILESVPAAVGIAQHLCDMWNHTFGLTVPQ